MVEFQVRSSDIGSAFGPWSDTLSTPIDLTGLLTPGDRYFQYKAVLSTCYPYTCTPVLESVQLNWNPVGTGEDEAVSMVLLPFSPNPASSPVVRFGRPEPGITSITVFDLAGRLVLEESGGYQAGFHEMTLDGLSPGIYFCRMTSGDYSAARRFVVIRQ
jgi:hypothetical protein